MVFFRLSFEEVSNILFMFVFMRFSLVFETWNMFRINMLGLSRRKGS